MLTKKCLCNHLPVANCGVFQHLAKWGIVHVLSCNQRILQSSGNGRALCFACKQRGLAIYCILCMCLSATSEPAAGSIPGSSQTMSTLYMYEWLTLPRLPGAAVEVMSDGRLWTWLSFREAFQYYGHNKAPATCALDGARTVEIQCEGKAVTLYRVQVGLTGYIPPRAAGAGRVAHAQ